MMNLMAVCFYFLLFVEGEIKACQCSQEEKGKCILTESADVRLACRCETYDDGVLCAVSSIEKCHNYNSKYCLNPDTTVQSCVQGMRISNQKWIGNCEGYHARDQMCLCKNVGKGECKLENKAATETACKCTHESDKNDYCHSQIVPCRHPTSQKCINLDTSKEACLEAVGSNCLGYPDECECKHFEDGCIIVRETKKPIRACKCILREDTKCSGVDTTCKHMGQKCSYPDTSYKSCLLGGGDCKGYRNLCDCEFFKGGCFIDKFSRRRKTACRCDLVSNKCSGHVVPLCRDPENAKCEVPDATKEACLQAFGGNCRGYRDECECEFLVSGCIITKVAQTNSACKCIKFNENTCSGYNVPCKDPNAEECKVPDDSKEACEQGGGDCTGYDYCQCGKHNNGCVITRRAPRNHACRCTFNEDQSNCNGAVTQCNNPIDEYCKNPDDSIRSYLLANDSAVNSYPTEPDTGGSVNADSCKCKFVDNGPSSKGCVISEGSVPNYFCNCKNTLKIPPNKSIAECKGENVDCLKGPRKDSNERSEKCLKPAKDYDDCIFGTFPEFKNFKICKASGLSDDDCNDGIYKYDNVVNGDCGGYMQEYGDGCKCRYNLDKSGCKISKAAQPGKACKCTLEPPEKKICRGSSGKCKSDQPSSSNSYYCTHPDTSVDSCKEAIEGNCAGY